jgi:hypothetical protein
MSHILLLVRENMSQDEESFRSRIWAYETIFKGDVIKYHSEEH